MTNEKVVPAKLELKKALKIALDRHNQKFMLPLFEGFEINQADVDFANENTTSNAGAEMELTLKWVSGRMNAAYRKEFMGEISAMRKAVDDANAQSDKTKKTARRDFWITFAVSLTISLVALVLSIFTYAMR